VYGTKYLKENQLTNKLYNLLLVLDRFHRKGHVRPMCRKIMNPDDSQHGTMFKNVNTSVCEQFFSFLTKFRYSLRGFNYPTSTLFTLLLFHLKNCHTTGIKTNAFGLGRCSFSDKIKPHFLSSCVFESVHFDIGQQQNKQKEKECEEELDEEELRKDEPDEEESDEEEYDEEESSEGESDEELDEQELCEEEPDEEESDEEETNDKINKK
jgi:hypothetical protein